MCDCIPERAEKLAAEYGNPKVYVDYHELLADPGVDAVCICTPSGMHADMGIAAAGAGKHVLCEKPIDIDLDKIDRLTAACRQAGVKLGCIFQRRTSGMWRNVREVVRSGRLGRMVLGDAYLKYYRSQEYYDSGDWRGTWALDGGGALMNQGVHCVDVLQWIMGPVRSVFAYTAHLVRNIEVEDTAVAALSFASGAFGVIEGTTSVTPGMDHRLEFHGAEGTIRVDGEKMAAWDVPGDEPAFFEGNGGVDMKAGTAASSPTAIGTEGHQMQVENLVRAVREDHDPMVTGEEARRSVEIILAIYESSRTGREVRLPLG